jgi:hypothetical protein
MRYAHDQYRHKPLLVELVSSEFNELVNLGITISSVAHCARNHLLDCHR